MESDSGLVLVAMDGTDSVGYSLAEIRAGPPGVRLAPAGYIDQMAVTAAYRRTGIGEQMLNEIVTWFRSKGIKRVELATTAANRVGNTFWLKHGFSVYLYTLHRQI